MTEDRFPKNISSGHEHLPVRPDFSSGEAPVNEGLETLRLLAEMPAPAGLEDRVHRRISAAHEARKQRSFWSLWKPAQRLQFAGAAVLMVVIGASSWTVFRGRVVTETPGQPAPASPAPVSPAGGFAPAGAERRPSTVNPIKVPPAPKKKPGAGHAAVAKPRVTSPQ
jgi:hypothetical protein